LHFAPERFALFKPFCAFHVAASIARRGEINYTQIAFYSTFIGKRWGGGKFPSFAIGQKMA
jgi:hypothetical protein